MKTVLLLCIVCFTSLNEVFGIPSELSLIESDSPSLNRTRRGWGDVLGPFGQLAATAIENSGKCAEKAGCHKGLCWTWCGLSLSGGDWCYTTKAHSQSFKYVKCSSDSQCDPCWKCASSCTL